MSHNWVEIAPHDRGVDKTFECSVCGTQFDLDLDMNTKAYFVGNTSEMLKNEPSCNEMLLVQVLE